MNGELSRRILGNDSNEGESPNEEEYEEDEMEEQEGEERSVNE